MSAAAAKKFTEARETALFNRKQELKEQRLANLAKARAARAANLAANANDENQEMEDIEPEEEDYGNDETVDDQDVQEEMDENVNNATGAKKRGRPAKAGSTGTKGTGVSGSAYAAKRVRPEVAKIVFNQNTGLTELVMPKGELNQKNAAFQEYRKTLRKSPWFSKQPKHIAFVYSDAKMRTPGSVRRAFRKSRKAIMNHPSYLKARPRLAAAIAKKRKEYRENYKGLSAEELRKKGVPLFIKGKRSATGNKLRHNFKAQLVKDTMKQRSDAALKKQIDYKFALKQGLQAKAVKARGRAQVPSATGTKWAGRYSPAVAASYFRRL